MKYIQKKKLFGLIGFFLFFYSPLNSQVNSVARDWNNILLFAIRHDFARPTVHARNLYHHSLIVYDTWAAFDPSKERLFLGDTLHGFICPFNGITIPANIEEEREKAISYASYHFILNRFQLSPGYGQIITEANNYMASKNYPVNIVSTDYSQGSAQLGNYIAEQIQLYGLQDGSNMGNNYQNQFYSPINPPIAPGSPGNPTMIDPNHWQAITLAISIDQAGNIVQNTPPFLSPEWGEVDPFVMSDTLFTELIRDGDTYKVYNNPGPPAILNVNDSSNWDSFYKWNHTLVSVWQSHLDPTDGVMWDISPNNIGNNLWYPSDSTEYAAFYDLQNGGDQGIGYTLNPITGQPYAQQIVPRGDYARVLAEFWADGINSETPPGHWYEIYHQTSNQPLFQFKWAGVGPDLSILEYDCKAHLALGGAVHDAAISAWSIKGYYDYVRPLSAIRYMADQGQSSDPNLPNYSTDGIPLLTGFVELVEIGDSLAGPSNENVGKIKLFTWKGHDYIQDPLVDVAGVGWILAENWWPYQRPSFVTPPFAGYISGHSTFSRAAAEVMTYMTGSPYFPGGLGEFDAPQNQFLEFEDGPSVPIVLQWATYRDASDQCSLSRIWGGIHPPCDDIPGRMIGKLVGELAFNKIDGIYGNELPALISASCNDSIINCADFGATRQVIFTFNNPMDISIIPTIDFQNFSIGTVLSINNSSWSDSTHLVCDLNVLTNPLEENMVVMNISGVGAAYVSMAHDWSIQLQLEIDTKKPVLENYLVSSSVVNDFICTQSWDIDLTFSEKCDTTVSPLINFNGGTLNSNFVISSNSSWLSENMYHAVYSVIDNNVATVNASVDLSSVFDLAQNIMLDSTVLNAFVLDTENPNIQSYFIQDDTLTLSDLASPINYLDIYFNQAMDVSTVPLIDFQVNSISIDVLQPLFVQSSWVSNQHYKYAFYLTNQAVSYNDVDVQIIGAKDENDNILLNDTISSVLLIDMIKPSISTIQANRPVIADSVVGNGLYFIDVSFDEAMDQTVKPLVKHLHTNPLTGIIQYNVASSYYVDSVNYRAFYTVNDTEAELQEISLQVQYAKDKLGNEMNAFLTTNFINLDTKNPNVSALYSNDYQITTGDNLFSSIIVFDEPMFEQNLPELLFSDNVILTSILTVDQVNSYWLNPEAYQKKYIVGNLDYINDSVSIDIQAATDLAGNEVNPYPLENYLAFNLEYIAGIQELQGQELILYPNPFANKFNNLSIKSVIQEDVLKFDLYTYEGKFVRELLFNKNDLNHFTCSDLYLMNGMYSLRNSTLGIVLQLIVQE